MYAVIHAGGKQYKVSEGDVVAVERMGDDGTNVEFTPLLVVDDDGRAHVEKAALSSARVTGKIVEEIKGPKVRIFKYRSKSRYRRTAGHRQRYSNVEISSIKLGGRRAASKTAEESNGT